MIDNMDEVNQELFLEMLLKLDGSHESIKAASKWCRANAQHHQDIVKMWFFAVAKARTMIRRLDLFHLASDILFTAEAHSVQFFSSFLPQLVKAVPLVRGEEINQSMKKLFSLWREKNIYNKVVMDKLDKLLRNKNKVVDMNVFRYDKELLFKNLHRLQKLQPACDYLEKSIEKSPSFENSQRLLCAMKERKSCQSLLSAVDSHKMQVTTLVSYLEEMVHLLKMTAAALDIAANREQNGVEMLRLKQVAYGRFNEKVLSILHRLESNYNIMTKSKIALGSPLKLDERTLFSRRPAGNYSGESQALVQFPPADWTPSPRGGFVNPTDNEIFSRRDSYGHSQRGSSTPTREDNSWYPASPSYGGNSPHYSGNSSRYNDQTSWGSSQSGPIYQKWFTGVNQSPGPSLLPLQTPSPLLPITTVSPLLPTQVVPTLLPITPVPPGSGLLPQPQYPSGY